MPGKVELFQASILFVRVIRDRPWALSWWRDLSIWPSSRVPLWAMSLCSSTLCTLRRSRSSASFYSTSLSAYSLPFVQRPSESADSHDTAPLEAEASSHSFPPCLAWSLPLPNPRPVVLNIYGIHRSSGLILAVYHEFSFLFSLSLTLTWSSCYLSAKLPSRSFLI